MEISVALFIRLSGVHSEDVCRKRIGGERMSAQSLHVTPPMTSFPSAMYSAGPEILPFVFLVPGLYL